MSKTWFITGANRGFGREFAASALSRGDRVAATARRSDDLQDLVREFGDTVLPLELDVTDQRASRDAVHRAIAHFGGLDVVVNNAGYGLFGAVEELSVQELRDQIEVNLFGVLHVTQAALPTLREQGSGHIVQISSVGGIIASPGLGGYHASKWALEGLSESLAQEVAGFGIYVTLVEPGGYSTDWGGSSAAHSQELPEYNDLRAGLKSQGGSVVQGDPTAAGAAMLDLVDAENPPLRAFFGDLPGRIVPDVYESRLRTWNEWSRLAVKAQGDEGQS